MLKFFRQYNKIILAVGIPILMVMFLIQPTLQMFMPDPAEEVVGTVDGVELTVADIRRADGQLSVISTVHPLLKPFGVRDPLQWELIQRDARAMGLSASDAEVRDMLAILGEEAGDAGSLARRMGVPVGSLVEALRSRLIYQRYWSLVQGHTHLSVARQLEHVIGAEQLRMAGNSISSVFSVAAALGAPRISEPLRDRFLSDLRTAVRITAVVIEPDRYEHRIDTPTHEKLETLYEQYKEFLPGQGRPYGLGYRFPDRAKIEFLEIPIARVATKVAEDRLDEAELMSYYDSHPSEFKPPAPMDNNPNSTQTPAPADTPRVPRPYAEVRKLIISKMRQQKASSLCEQMVKAAQAILIEDARRRPVGESTHSTASPTNHVPIGLHEVAKRLHDQFDVLPVVQVHDSRWLSIAELAQLPGINNAMLPGGRPVRFIEYVTSAQELVGDNASHPLASMGLRAGQLGSPLISVDGDRYLFRLTAAESSRVPKSLDEVVDQVTEDAVRVALYELLKQDASTWSQRAADETLDGLATSIDTAAVRPVPIRKRTPGEEGSIFKFGAPYVEAIGKSEAFVDEVFDLARRVVAAGGPEQVPAGDRLATIAVDRTMRLAVVRVDEILPGDEQPMPEAESQSLVDAWIGQSMSGEALLQPVSVEDVSLRIGFDSADEPADTDAPDSEDGPEEITADEEADA